MKNILLAVLLIGCQFMAGAQSAKARINHVAIFVVDLNKSASFYQHIIGLDSIAEPFHDGKHVWLSIGPGASLHIIEGADQPKSYFKNNHLCFSVTSVERFTGLLQKEGLQWEDVMGKKGSITTRVDNVKQIWMKDPDGYWLEINDAKD